MRQSEILAKWEDENVVQELDNFDEIFAKFSKPKSKLEIAEKEEEKVEEEDAQGSTVLFCADVIKVEQKVMKAKKKKSNFMPEPLEAS